MRDLILSHTILIPQFFAENLCDRSFGVFDATLSVNDIEGCFSRMAYIAIKLSIMHSIHSIERHKREKQSSENEDKKTCRVQCTK